MRKNFGAKPILYPQAVFIIGSYDENGNSDAMNAAWGGVAASGTHSQLLERSPLYKKLFETQFTVPVKEDDHGTTDHSFDGRAA